jgi:alanine dehydrogenase
VADFGCPKRFITRAEMFLCMQTGSVIIKMTIDQISRVWLSKDRTHSNPTIALEITAKGYQQAMQENPKIKRGANVINANVMYQKVVAYTLDIE